MVALAAILTLGAGEVIRGCADRPELEFVRIAAIAGLGGFYVADYLRKLNGRGGPKNGQDRR